MKPSDILKKNNDELIQEIIDLAPNDPVRQTAELMLQIRLTNEINKQSRIMTILTFVMAFFMVLQIVISLGAFPSPPLHIQIENEPIITKISNFSVVCEVDDKYHFTCNVITER